MGRGTAHNHSAQNLPHRLTSFIGRDVELAELGRLLRERRLVTLTGAGGSGKTRLAIEAAATLVENFPGGIFMVELAPLARPELVNETVAHSLGVDLTPERSPVEVLTGFLSTRTALLVLDNCEHLLDECARLAGYLLATCLELRVLATSREPLGVGGECIFNVPLLTRPDSGSSLDPSTLTDFESVQLFVDRARLANRDFALTRNTAEAVAQVCMRLDGIPLALELAAASLRALPVTELAARLDQRFRLLTSGDRTALPRHRTLNALLDWSYSLLEERQQMVFRRLAAFPAEWTLEAAESVCADTSLPRGDASLSPEEVLDTLMQLVNKSLVQLEHASGRYRMLETVRLYALGKLRAVGEYESVVHRHVAWYLGFAEQGSVHFGGPGQQQWFERLESEQANLRAALSWAIEAGRAEEAARMGLALWRYWEGRGYHGEARRWLERVLELGARSLLSPLLRARLLNALGSLLNTMNDFEQASRYLNEALSIWREQGDNAGIAEALLGLGWRHYQAMDLDVARSYAEESLALARQGGDRPAVAGALNLFALAGIEGGRIEGVVPVIGESLSIWRDLGALPEVAGALINLARVEQRLGNLDRARPLMLEATRLQVALGNYEGLIGCLVLMVYFAFDSGKTRPNHPEPGFQQFDYLDGAKLPHGFTKATQVLGVMAAWEAKVMGKHGVYWDALVVPLIEKLRTDRGGANFEREFAAGEAMTMEDIVALAEEIALPPQEISDSDSPPLEGGPPSEALYPAGLTQREVEVLRLVASGLTNAQAAERLSVTSRTVNAHLTSIYAKTGVAGRAGAVRFAIDHGLG